MALLLSCAWLGIVTWLLFHAFAQRHLIERVVPTKSPAPETAPSIAVIIPARDEEFNIGPCLQSLLGQDYPSARLSIVVVDDHSADATILQAKAAAQANPRVNILACPPLPPAWVGKSHACWIGARSVPRDTEWLCFIDADVRAEPTALASAVITTEAQSLDLLSLAPHQQLVSFAERLMIPCGFYILGFCRDLRETQASTSQDVTATGQFILVRHRLYDVVGGHAAIRSEICEDVALARLIKRAGGNVTLRDGQRIISTRMYTGWPSLWPGLVKNLVDMLGGPRSALTTAFAAFVLAWSAYLIPLADGIQCAAGKSDTCIALIPALVATLAAIAFHAAGTFYFSIPVWYGLIFPLGYTIGAIMAVDSVRRRFQGRVPWKGRTYP